MLRSITVLISSLMFALLTIQMAAGTVSEQDGRFLALEFTGTYSEFLTQENIEKARALGVNIILTDGEEPIDHIDLSEFLFILSATERFTTPHLLGINRTIIAENLIDRYRQLNQRYPGRISAVELFRDPHDISNRFPVVASQLADTVGSLIETPLFYTSRFFEAEAQPLPSGYHFRGMNVSPISEIHQFPAPITIFSPDEKDLRKSMVQLRELLTADTGYENSILVLPAGWLLKLIDERPATEIALRAFTSGDTVTLPLPAPSEKPLSINWSVLFLFLLWISFMVHFSFQPMYVQSLPRYFLNHIFYVIDVMEHRIRNALPGIIVMVQHALLTGLFLFVSAEILVSETGLSALSYHFPVLFLSGNELLSLFFLGVLIALAMQFVSVLWIHLLNKKLQFFSQTLNLYSWPLHINLAIVTLVVVFNQTGTADSVIAGFSVLFALTWFMSFNVAAIDAARFLDNGKVVNIFLTVGLHTLIVVLLVWYLLTNPAFIEPVQLAFFLP